MQDLLLLIVSYHSSHSEVSALSDCLDSLSDQISYAVIVNDFNERDPITVLEKHSELFLRNEDNLGYGRAINKLFTSHIEGDDESGSILKFLFEHIHQDKYPSRFSWENNSIAFWDNRSVLHKPVNDYWPQQRRMERITIES